MGDKPYRVHSLQGLTPQAVADLNDEIDAIYRWLRKVQAGSISDGVFAPQTHALLGPKHLLTASGAPVNGDLIIAQAGLWARFPVGSNGRVLVVSAGAPAWALIVNANVDAAAAIAWTKINKAGSSLADLATRAATDLTTTGIILLGRDTANAGAVEELTPAQAVAVLPLFAQDLKGLTPGPSAGDIAADRVLQADGTWVDQFTGPVTPGDIVMTGPAFVGRDTVGLGVAEELDTVEATAMLHDFVGDSGTGGIAGLVPAPAAGDAAAMKFLRADGTWAAIGGATAVYVYVDTDQTLADGVEEALVFTDALFDTDSMWAASPDPELLTVPADGLYCIRGKLAVNSAFVGVATLRIYVNGTKSAEVSEAGMNLTSNAESHELSVLLALTAGDEIEFRVLLDITLGGSHDVTGGDFTTTTFAAFKVTSGGGSGGGGSASIEIGTEAARPAAGTDQRLYLPTDGSYIHEDDGAVWRSWGPISPQVLPTTSGFTLINGSTATVSLNAAGRLVIEATALGNVGNVIMYTKTAPATPWSFIVRADAVALKRDFLSWGICFRASGSGAFAIFGFVAVAPIFVVSSSKGVVSGGVPVLSAHYVQAAIEPLPWLKIEDDGVNRNAYLSADGVSWFLFHTIGRTDHLTADEYGYFLINQNTSAPNYGLMMSVSSAEIR